MRLTRRVRFETQLPPPPLDEFVALFWYFEGYPAVSARERLLPTGTTELVFNLRESETRIFDAADPRRVSRLPGSIICGPHSESFVIDTDVQDCVLGVHFKPGGARPFFDPPADEFHNGHVSLAEVWDDADDLHGQILASRTPRAKFRVLERALLGRLQRGRRHPAVAFALGEFCSGAVRSVGDVMAQLGYSARHFIKLFTTEVGFTPKRFARVQRFHHAVRRVHPMRDVDWADVAATCGYFDQAHFIHDFRDFAGLTPTEYLARRTPHMNHVPIT